MSDLDFNVEKPFVEAAPVQHTVHVEGVEHHDVPRVEKRVVEVPVVERRVVDVEVNDVVHVPASRDVVHEHNVVRPVVESIDTSTNN